MFNKRLLNKFHDNMKYVAIIVFTQWISLLINVVLIYNIAGFIDDIYRQQITKEMIIKLVVVLMITVLVKSAMNTVGSKMSFKTSNVLKTTLRNDIYKKLVKMGSNYSEKIATSEVVQVSTEGVEQLEIYFGKYVPQFFYSMLAPLTLFVIVASMSMKVAIVLLICVPLIPMSIVAVQKFAKKMLNKYWGTYTELGDCFLENLQGLTTLKIYEADESYGKKMDEEAEKFRKVTMCVLIMQLNSISIMDLVAYGGAALGIILSLLEFRAENLSFTHTFFILMISAEFFLPLRLLGSFFHIAMNGNAAAKKIFKILDIEEVEKGKITDLGNKEIVFQNVSFAYEEKNVLKDISFRIKNKSFTAIAGVSGSGKSTIASLLMGINQGYKGNITVGNAEVSLISEEALFDNITYIGHNSYLFKGSIRENLLMGNKKASDKELEAVLLEVDMLDTVRSLGGLDMNLSERGENISGGQKQRLALARAILHNSDVYIFDEATSNIDAESENKIINVIEKMAKNKTIILISHRLANLKNADQILVLSDGGIVETGTNEELVKKNGAYAKMYLAQMKLESIGKETA